jgi:hypothetical protein
MMIFGILAAIQIIIFPFELPSSEDMHINQFIADKLFDFI